ncbi:MAG: DUF1127 domain-containing protein [Hyphomicrobiaceae bacterium]
MRRLSDTYVADEQVLAAESTLQDLLRRFGQAIMQRFELIAQARTRRLAAAELRRLDDRMLADIGLTRSEIDSVLDDASGERRRSIATRR